MAKKNGNSSTENHRNVTNISNFKTIDSSTPEQSRAGETQEQSSGSVSGKQPAKKQVAKAYEKYVEQFTPKPKYFSNSLKAFIVGGLICVVSLWIENQLITGGIPEKDAATYVVILLVMAAQLLTGLGWFDTIGKHVGAGVIVPITGFANSMVAPAIEYKKEGIVLGVGAKLFSLAGPVLVSGITASMIIGFIYWVFGL